MNGTRDTSTTGPADPGGLDPSEAARLLAETEREAVIPAAAPLIIVGTTALGIAASKADWPQFGAALAVVIAGVVAAFAGPSGAWLAAGIGLFIALVGYAVADALRHRRVPLRA
jgi:hypothetical protein